MGKDLDRASAYSCPIGRPGFLVCFSELVRVGLRTFESLTADLVDVLEVPRTGNIFSGLDGFAVISSSDSVSSSSWTGPGRASQGIMFVFMVYPSFRDVVYEREGNAC